MLRFYLLALNFLKLFLCEHLNCTETRQCIFHNISYENGDLCIQEVIVLFPISIQAKSIPYARHTIVLDLLGFKSLL